MTLDPWIIDQAEQEKRRREEEARLRRARIELPQSPGSEGPQEEAEPADQNPGRVQVVEISPGHDNVYPI